MTVRRINGAGLQLAVEERGDRADPTVVLIHGYPDCRAMWVPVAERLAARYHVVTYDVRGAGESAAPLLTEGYRFPLLMDDLAAVLDAVSPDAPVHLVGHDWGSLQGWEAVSGERLRGRIASYTSINGVPLDHAQPWARAHLRPTGVGAVARQALRSSYMAAFQLPGAPTVLGLVGSKLDGGRQGFARFLHRAEGLTADDSWPAPTFGRDVANGMHLYRANVLDRLRRPVRTGTDVPVQLVVGRDDPFVPPALVDGLESWSPRTWRRDVPAGHWVTRSNPAGVARWIGDLVDHIEGGDEPNSLRRCRVGRDHVDRVDRTAVGRQASRSLL